MQKSKLEFYQRKYSDALFKDVIPFWLEHGMDSEYGGIYTCVDRVGTLYNTDKSVWFQGRAAWIFAKLCSEYGVREEWKNASLSCLNFLRSHCIDPTDRRMFFITTKDGKPLRKRRYFFSETFYVIAAAQAAAVFGEADWLDEARVYFDLLYKIYKDPTSDPYKITPKYYVDNRPTRDLATPMILLNVSHVLIECDPTNAATYQAAAQHFTNDIFKYSYKDDFEIFLETTGYNGEFLHDVTSGRTVNPGHSIEAAWFLLKQAQMTNDLALAERSERVFNRAMDIGWDKEFGGGILAFTDILGFPPEQLEHDMKLWWPTNEAMICSLLLYEHTGNQKYFDVFEETDRYAFSKFADPEFGEWFGYLHRDGTPTLPPCKGNLFKGPFHIPRMLIMVEHCMQRLAEKTTD